MTQMNLRNKLIALILSGFMLNGLGAEANKISAVTAANQVASALTGETEPVYLHEALLEIAVNGHELPIEQKQLLMNLGFDFSGKYVVYTRPVLDYYIDQGIFRIHYSTSGTDAVDNTDSDSDGIPDYVEQVAEAFQQTADKEITELGFTRPPGDSNNGGSNNYDIYLENMQSGYYAITYADAWVQDNPFSQATEINAWSSYIVMRNNYTGFPNTELENIQVTAAHEFFHAIQYGYDGWEEIWLLEATAVLMEEVVFDDVNDCYQYMPNWFDSPYESLTLNTVHAYGSFIYFKYIEEHLGGLPVIKSIFDYSIEHDSYDDDYSRLIIDEALDEVGSSFSDALNKMAIANLIMSSSAEAGIYSYEEADYYPVTGPEIESVIPFSPGDNKSVTNSQLDVYGSQYYQIDCYSPVMVSLANMDGPSSDLEMHTVAYEFDNSITVQSGSVINVPAAQSVYVIIISQDDTSNDWDFQLTLQDGVIGPVEFPDDFDINITYPNPLLINEQLSVELIAKKQQNISAYVYDLSGRRTANLYSGPMNYGIHNDLISWNGRDNRGMPVASGLYFIVVEGKNKMVVEKITVLK